MNVVIGELTNSEFDDPPASVAEPEPVGAGTFLVGAGAGAGVKM